MTTQTTFQRVKCFFGKHLWGEPKWVSDRLPNIVRASIEHMNLGKEHECLSCGKLERVHYV